MSHRHVHFPFVLGMIYLWTLLTLTGTGCSLDGEQRVTVDGHTYWFDRNRIQKIVKEPSAALQSDTQTDSFVYYYHGKPVLLHVWWDVWKNLERYTTMVNTVPLIQHNDPDQIVTCSGCVRATRKLEGSAMGSMLRLAAGVDDRGTMYASLPIEQRMILSGRGFTLIVPRGDQPVVWGPGSHLYSSPLCEGQTLILASWYCLYGPVESDAAHADQPQKGMLLAMLKVRLIAFPRDGSWIEQRNETGTGITLTQRNPVFTSAEVEELTAETPGSTSRPSKGAVYPREAGGVDSTEVPTPKPQ